MPRPCTSLANRVDVGQVEIRDAWTIMPNHVHGIVVLTAEGVESHVAGAGLKPAPTDSDTDLRARQGWRVDIAGLQCVRYIHITKAEEDIPMARVQLIIPDEDRDRFVHQARKEGMTFSAWLRAAARERLEKQQQLKQFESPEEVREFFRACAVVEGSGKEPNWSEHLKVMEESRSGGATGT